MQVEINQTINVDNLAEFVIHRGEKKKQKQYFLKNNITVQQEYYFCA